MDVLNHLTGERSFPILLVAICFAVLTSLVFNRRQREVVLGTFRIRVRRASSANTPPRSLSPEKKPPSNTPPTSTEFVNTFPPNRRDALAAVADRLPPGQRQALGDLKFDEEIMKQNLMSFFEDFRECDDSKYTAAGVSLKEVRALGDFPDYAELSGVPLPDPYEGFDIDKALARPYRPFRWAYHQTMCKLLHTPMAPV